MISVSISISVVNLKSASCTVIMKIGPVAAFGTPGTLTSNQGLMLARQAPNTEIYSNVSKVRYYG